MLEQEKQIMDNLDKALADFKGSRQEHNYLMGVIKYLIERLDKLESLEKPSEKPKLEKVPDETT